MAAPALVEPRGKASPPKTIVELMKSPTVAERFLKYVPAGVDGPRLFQTAKLAMQRDAAFLELRPLVVMQAMLGVTQLGLPINTPEGHAYLIAFGKGQQATLQVIIGVRGFYELGYRTGKLISVSGDIATMEEYDRGLFEFQKGTEQYLRHRFTPGRIEGEGEAAFGYCVAQVKAGPAFDVMTWDSILRIRSASSGYQYAKSKGTSSSTYLKTPWVAHAWQMGVKTVARRLFKTMEISAEVAAAIALDEASEGARDLSEVLDLDPAEWGEVTDAEKRAEDAQGEKDREPERTEKPAAAPRGRTREQQAQRNGASKPTEEPAGGPDGPEPPPHGEAAQEQPREAPREPERAASSGSFWE